MLAVVGGLAFAGYRLYLNEVEDSAIELVPPDAVVYGNIYLNPSTRQKQALRDLLEHFPSAATPDEATERLEGLFDDVLTPFGLEYGRDVQPWLGRQIAAYVTLQEPDLEPTGAVLIATNDPDASMDAFRSAWVEVGEQSESHAYKGVEYEVTDRSDMVVGVVGGFLVVASSPLAFENSVDAEGGRSLADTREFRDASRGLPSDRLALFFVNLEPTLAALRGDGFPVLSAEDVEAFGSPAAAVAYLRSDAVVLEARFPGEGGRPGGTLERVPANASVAVAQENLGGYLESQFEILGPLGVAAIDVGLQDGTGLDLEDDLLSWMAGFALYFDLGDPDRPARVARIESRNPSKSAAALQKIQMTLIREGIPLERVSFDGRQGFRLRFPGAPGSAVLVEGADGVTAAAPADAIRAAVRPEATLGDDPQYRDALDALGSGFSAAFFARIGPLLDQIGHEVNESSPGEAAQFDEARPDLDPFSFIIYGSRQQGGNTYGRLVIGVE